jgi:hypothetical protein
VTTDDVANARLYLHQVCDQILRPNMATRDDIREIVREEVREVVTELLRPIKDSLLKLPRLLCRVCPFLSSESNTELTHRYRR